MPRTDPIEADVFQDGYEGYWGGIDSDDNPHPYGTVESLAWDEGWSQAQLEDDEELEI
jgi:hypothetical protein